LQKLQHVVGQLAAAGEMQVDDLVLLHNAEMGLPVVTWITD
jgi:hypothetical protein